MSIFADEQNLPPLWKDGFYNPARFDFYTKLVLNSGLVRGGREVVAEFIAAMCMESSLDNLIVGNNAKNGSSNASLGIGWCQLDTAYHIASLDWMHLIRLDPEISLIYVCDESNGLCSQGGIRTHFNRQFWHAWKPSKIDPTTGWSPLAEAEKAYDRAITQV